MYVPLSTPPCMHIHPRTDPPLQRALGRSYQSYEVVEMTAMSSSSLDDSSVTDDMPQKEKAGAVQPPTPHHEDQETSRGFWAIHSLIGYGGAMLVSMIIPYFSYILGLIASLISSQVHAHVLLSLAYSLIPRPRLLGLPTP